MDKPTPKPSRSPKPLPKRNSEDSALPEEDLSESDADPATDPNAMGSTRVMDGSEHVNAADSDATQLRGKTQVQRSSRGAMVHFTDFEPVKLLGEGAMGAVYQARQISYDRVVALKVLFPHVANNPKLVARLHKEAKAMFELDHPNIIHSYGIFEEDGHHFVAMEFVNGDSLQKWLSRLGHVSVEDAIYVTLECCRALDYAHSRKMVHRDIKPDNILITKTGKIKVADLGMVKQLDDEEMGLTQTGHAVGTPWYMPLEQARSAKDSDGRADIYALGCMLYCMLTGNPPFTGQTLVEVIEAKERGTFAPARKSNPNVPERLDLIIMKMTAKRVSDRYQSCAEVIADLEALGLASDRPTFLLKKPTTSLKAATPPAARAASTMEAPSDVWYLRIHKPDGTDAVRKLTTAQLKKMIEEGTVDPTAKASRQPEEGFRALAAYKEFQAVAVLRQSKKATDKNASKYRDLYKQAEDKERQRAQAEEVKEERPEYDLASILKPVLIVGGSLVGAVVLLYVLAQLFR